MIVIGVTVSPPLFLSKEYAAIKLSGYNYPFYARRCAHTICLLTSLCIQIPSYIQHDFYKVTEVIMFLHETLVIMLL